MSKIPHFLTHMDRGAWRAVGVIVGLFALVGIIILLSRHYLDIDGGQIGALLASADAKGLALPITIVAFSLFAFIGAPQIILIAAAVVAFGPWQGVAFSYIATLISAIITFYFGRWTGAARLKRYGGDFINRFLGIVQRNGFLASSAVRLVPTAPFIIVNMAAGVSGMSIWPYLVGTAVGIIPKIAAVAFFSEGVKGAATGANWPVIAGFSFIGVVFIGIMLVARRRLRRVVQEPIKPPLE